MKLPGKTTASSYELKDYLPPNPGLPEKVFIPEIHDPPRCFGYLRVGGKWTQHPPRDSKRESSAPILD